MNDAVMFWLIVGVAWVVLSAVLIWAMCVVAGQSRQE